MDNNKGNRLGGNINRCETAPALHRRVFTTALAFLTAVFALTPAMAAYKVSEAGPVGAVSGKVLIGGAKPQVERIAIFKDNKVCGRGSRDITLVQANGDALINAVVYLKDVKFGKPFPAAAKKITLNQLGCRFTPYLSVMANGGEMEVINSDDVLHNIHTYEIFGPANYSTFSVSQPQRGNIVTKEINLHRGDSLRVHCDAHNFMLAFIFIARNPYYAIVDSDGEFLIENVPPGRYSIRVWHGVLGEKQGTVTITANGKAKFDFSY